LKYAKLFRKFAEDELSIVSNVERFALRVKFIFRKFIEDKLSIIQHVKIKFFTSMVLKYTCKPYLCNIHLLLQYVNKIKFKKTFEKIDVKIIESINKCQSLFKIFFCFIANGYLNNVYSLFGY